LTCEASLAEELAGARNGDDRFLALWGYDRELYLTLPEVEQRIRKLPLPENAMVHFTFYYCLSAKDAIEQNFLIGRLLFGSRQTTSL
jgi:hypothetical protein